MCARDMKSTALMLPQRIKGSTVAVADLWQARKASHISYHQLRTYQETFGKKRGEEEG